MFDEKYQECERLYKRRKIGIGMNVVAVIIFFISLLVMILFSYIPNNITKIIYSVENIGIYIIIIWVICAFIPAIATIFFLEPYDRYLIKISKEIKEHFFKQELQKNFNTYQVEDHKKIESDFSELSIRIEYLDRINDCFTAKYNHTEFTYLDAQLVYSSRDIYHVYFEGPVFIIPLKDSIHGELIISKKEKELQKYDTNISDIVEIKKFNKIEPIYKRISDNIEIHSNIVPSMIEDSSFQDALNDLVDNEEYILILKDNQLYVFIYNDKDSFQILVGNKQEEEEALKEIQTEMKTLQGYLDKIISYKEGLNIKNDIF